MKMPKSKKLWMQAARKACEGDPSESKKRKLGVLKRALEHIPNDLEIWKEAIALEDEDGAKALLYRAVECVPDSTELWLALAKLESYEKAQDVLNRAIQTIQTDHTIWVNAAMLEEAQGHEQKVSKLVKRSFRKLQEAGVNISREQWLKEAEQCEKSSSLVCSKSIIRESLNHGLDAYLESYTAEE